ncbi:heme biosynthesis HemY N-terminal domain-containing protein [Actinoplanes couchii]|uniref:Uncharacterized protein n=1 Tax=Actinoplanes couchii TaxID=403638 RepID=A0ABQ3XS01_9ACTN|nr:heme biosynthesis HemY N-terminal domain-containing protein [Actinoplanes couchii]MDR6318761.1 hypothetical protein [Actinoplanes couchii]GID61289.1 hypothetical protein Aco03nite_096930 [Actinoplanes couchii]
MGDDGPIAEPGSRVDLGRRRVTVRRLRLVLEYEQWGPEFVHTIAGTDEQERDWLDALADSGQIRYTPGRTVEQWRELREQQGRYTVEQAMKVFHEGDPSRARDLMDEALALGGLLEREWERTHTYLAGGPAPAD